MAKILCRLCGNTFIGRVSRVERLEQKSCGCIRRLSPIIDLTGQTINNILFVGFEGNGLWRVKFACGHSGALCRYRALNSATSNCSKCSNTGESNIVHGHSPKTKGKSKTYTTWLNMKKRCYDPKNNRYSTYGGRGIKVCDRWLEPKGQGFINFLKDMGEKQENLTLERINIDGDYCKENCVWATNIEQANNKTNNRLILSSSGEVWSLRRWCEILGIDYKNAWYQLFTAKRPIEVVLGEGYTLLSKEERGKLISDV